MIYEYRLIIINIITLSFKNTFNYIDFMYSGIMNERVNELIC